MGAIIWNDTNNFIVGKKIEIGALEGDWRKFLKALGTVENSGSYVDPVPPYVGKYQVGEDVLKDLDFFRRDGRWLGITDLASFGSGTTASAVAQEVAALKEFSGLDTPAASKYSQVRWELANKIDRTIDINVYLGISYTVTFSDGNQREVILTEAGISAAAHNMGPGAMAILLNDIIKGNTVDVSNAADGNGIAFTAYMELFQGFDIRPLIQATTQNEYNGFLCELLKDNGLSSFYAVDYWQRLQMNGMLPIILQSFTTAATQFDPLVLDLDGDGVETTYVNDGAYFDHDGNGFAEQTGWASSDDGLLVWDRNGDGIINDGKELFGDQTILQNGERATNGFQALAEWDDNVDGRIDANDAVWGNLKVWQDFDGYSRKWEMGSEKWEVI